MSHSPSIVPDEIGHDVYLVLDDIGRLGRVWRETEEEDSDPETVLLDLLAGQYSDPVRVVAFNTAEGWSRDVSAEFAAELVQRCVDGQREIPSSLHSFIERHYPKRLSA